MTYMYVSSFATTIPNEDKLNFHAGPYTFERDTETSFLIYR